MVLFDNGNRRDVPGISKAIEIEFTGAPPTSAAITWEWTLPGYSAFLGDADRLPGGNTLVTAGSETLTCGQPSIGRIDGTFGLVGSMLSDVSSRALRLSKPARNWNSSPAVWTKPTA